MLDVLQRWILFECASPNNQNALIRQSLEKLSIVGKMPWNPSMDTNDSISRHGCNDSKFVILTCGFNNLVM